MTSLNHQTISYLIIGTVCLDQRQEPCHLEYRLGMCTNTILGLFSRKTCCCSLGRGWGDKCSRCPRPGSQEFINLCGRTVADVNECAVFPGICSNGRCKNTAGSFECICNRGYALDETGFKETNSDIRKNEKLLAHSLESTALQCND